MRTNFPSSLSSYRHSISLFLVLHDNVNVLSRPTTCNFVTISIYICPIRSSLPYIHSSIFLLSPFPSPHLSTFNSPHPLVIRLISIPSHEQKRCTKSNFLFIFFALKHRNTRNSSKHSLRGLSMYLFPPVVFISHKQKKGIRVLFRKWKKRALRYNRRYQKLKITQILFFFFLAIAANNK